MPVLLANRAGIGIYGALAGLWDRGLAQLRGAVRRDGHPAILLRLAGTFECVSGLAPSCGRAE